MENDRKKRAWSSLVGLSVGDAFGERYFGPPKDALARIRARELAPTPWRWTDDTAMGLSVYENLARHGRIEQDDLATRFALRFIDEPARGYGGGAYELLTAIAQGASWRDVSPAVFNHTGSYGNGAAMRVAPVGAFFADSIPKAVQNAVASAEVTHAHADGIAGAVATAVATAYLTAVEAPSPEDLFAAVISATPKSKTLIGLKEAATVDPSEPIDRVGRQLGNGSRISAQDTVPLCVWIAAHHAPTYESAMWTTVLALGDRDTTCAIVGGMIGARHSPPSQWRAAAEPIPTAP